MPLLNALFFSVFGQELVSPCPGVFHYETDTITDDGWYGYAHLTTKDDLEGVFVHVVLDRPAITLGVSTERKKALLYFLNPRPWLRVGKNAKILSRTLERPVFNQIQSFEYTYSIILRVFVINTVSRSLRP